MACNVEILEIKPWKALRGLGRALGSKFWGSHNVRIDVLTSATPFSNCFGPFNIDFETLGKQPQHQFGKHMTSMLKFGTIFEGSRLLGIEVLAPRHKFLILGEYSTLISISLDSNTGASCKHLQKYIKKLE